MNLVARCAALLILVQVGNAAAGPADDDREAREHFALGSTQFDVGEFATAAEEFKKAYRASAAPSLLFNLGQAQRLNGDYEPALFSYHSYLRLFPKATYRGYVEARMAEMGEERKREVVLAAKEAARARRRQLRVRSPPGAPGAEPRPALRPSATQLMGFGIGAVAAGLALVGVGAVLSIAANASSGELPRRELGIDAASAVLLVVGGVTAIGGVALWLLTWRRDTARTPQVAVAASAREAGVVLRWRF
jgi:tetratricopeptide (TPR) repeat protein